jgi:hypothetical protein
MAFPSASSSEGPRDYTGLAGKNYTQIDGAATRKTKSTKAEIQMHMFSFPLTCILQRQPMDVSHLAARDAGFRQHGEEHHDLHRLSFDDETSQRAQAEQCARRATRLNPNLKLRRTIPGA